MGLGIFISSVSVAKTFMVGSYGKTGDTLMDTVGLATLSNIELQLAIIVACIPVLKRPFETVLRRFGLLSSQGMGSTGTPSHGAYYKHNDGSSRPNHYSQHLDSHKLATLQREQRKRGGVNELDIDTDSLESGEVPIMKTQGRSGGQDSGGSEASLHVGDYEPAVSSAPRGDKAVYFKTSIRGGQDGTERHSGEGGGHHGKAGDIKIETTVSVHSHIKPDRRAGADSN